METKQNDFDLRVCSRIQFIYTKWQMNESDTMTGNAFAHTHKTELSSYNTCISTATWKKIRRSSQTVNRGSKSKWHANNEYEMQDGTAEKNNESCSLSCHCCYSVSFRMEILFHSTMNGYFNFSFLRFWTVSSEFTFRIASKNEPMHRIRHSLIRLKCTAGLFNAFIFHISELFYWPQIKWWTFRDFLLNDLQSVLENIAFAICYLCDGAPVYFTVNHTNMNK